MDQQDNDNGNDLPEARGQPAEAPEEDLNGGYINYLDKPWIPG